MYNRQAVVNLEMLAVKAATEAVDLDKQGLTKLAIAKYMRATEILQKLCSLYPEASLNNVYREYRKRYSDRIHELQKAVNTKSVPVDSRKYDRKMLREKPDVQWRDVVGLATAKQAILDAIIYPCKRPDFFPLGWPRGILLFGPPGCGKTLLAAATAAEIDAAFYCIDSTSIMSKWLGESEKNVAHLFDTARHVSQNGQPSIIFIDEIDALIGVRSEEVGGEIRLRKQLMMEMDGITDKNRRLHVYVIGATNKPWNLDEPFLRRFQKRIYVQLPDYETRLGILKLNCKKLVNMDSDISFSELAVLTDGYSGSDIYDVVQAVHIKVVREFFKSYNLNDSKARLRPISMNDFYIVLEERKPSVSSELVILHENWYQKYKAL